MRILVADDNVINQRVTSALLESRGHFGTGMDAYVPKPIDAKVLFRAMGQLRTPFDDDSADEHSAEPLGDRGEGIKESSDAPVIDREAALEKLAGDEELLVEIIDLYTEDTPQVLAVLREAVQAGDADGVRKSAHRIKGSVGTLAATRAFEAARDLENIGREGDLDGLSGAFAVLDEELQRLAEALAGLRAELSGAG